MIWKPENTVVCWNIGTQLHDKSLGLSRFIYHCTQPSQFVTNKETGPPDSGWGSVGHCQSCPGSQQQASSVRRVGDRPGEPAHAYTDDAFTILSAEPRHLIKNISEMVKIYDEISNISALTLKWVKSSLSFSLGLPDEDTYEQLKVLGFNSHNITRNIKTNRYSIYSVC